MVQLRSFYAKGLEGTLSFPEKNEYFETLIGKVDVYLPQKSSGKQRKNRKSKQNKLYYKIALPSRVLVF